MCGRWNARQERAARIQKLRDLFDEQCQSQIREHGEIHLATNVMAFLEDVLAALPEKAKTWNLEFWFNEAARTWR